MGVKSRLLDAVTSLFFFELDLQISLNNWFRNRPFRIWLLAVINVYVYVYVYV